MSNSLTINVAGSLSFYRTNKAGKTTATRGILGVATSGNKAEKLSLVRKVFMGNNCPVIMQELARVWPASKMLKAGHVTNLAMGSNDTPILLDGDVYENLSIYGADKRTVMLYCKAIQTHIRFEEKEVKGEALIYETAMNEWVDDQQAYLDEQARLALENAKNTQSDEVLQPA